MLVNMTVFKLTPALVALSRRIKYLLHIILDVIVQLDY